MLFHKTWPNAPNSLPSHQAMHDFQFCDRISVHVIYEPKSANSVYQQLCKSLKQCDQRIGRFCRMLEGIFLSLKLSKRKTKRCEKFMTPSDEQLSPPLSRFLYPNYRIYLISFTFSAWKIISVFFPTSVKNRNYFTCFTLQQGKK